MKFQLKNTLCLAIILFLSILGNAQNSTNELNEELPIVSDNSVVSGFYNRFDVGILGGSAASRSFNIVNGYRMNEHWSAGLGLGVEEFYWNRYIPTYLEGNYNLLKKSTTPWLSVMAGYEIPTVSSNGTNRGGFTYGGKVGFSYFIGKHIGITTSIGYRYAHLQAETIWIGWDIAPVTTVTNINRYEFRFGMIFK
jgi:hypothetical protein